MTTGSFAEFKRRTIFLVVLVLIILLILNYASIFILFFASVLAATVLSGMAGWLSGRTGLRYGIALLSVVLGLGVIFLGLGALVGVPFVFQIEGLGRSLGSAYQDLSRRLAENNLFQILVEQFPLEGDWIRRLLSGPIFGVFSGIMGVITSMALILFTALYLSASKDTYFNGLLYLFPKGRRSRYEQTLLIIGKSLQFWMLGRVLSMIVIGILTGVGLWMIGIPLVLPLATIAALLAFVPVIGPIASAVPGVLLGLSQSPATGLSVLLVYLVVQILESYLITPIIDKQVVSMPPVLMIASQTVFGSLLGIVGVVFAAPLTLVLVIMVQRLYVQEELGYEVESIGKQP